MRIGQGVDAHPLVSGRPLVVGGVTIPFDRGLDGDSDGDVLTHAVMDALLGALVLGDLGAWFTQADAERVQGSSVALLQEVVRQVRHRGYRIVQMDSTVIAQAPRLSPYVPAIRERLSTALETPYDRVSVKATTTDHLGWIGRQEGMLATAMVLLEPIG